ncbi:hypothetical protein TRFO_16909 [Tritrichomonas foetus]|uniref:Uncharacterized protein n=1 Tax=Tritrichomonas foetus TaxID=1144522 RepID=A0A1J4KU03_9EUKA|nr:hypothetical protein TRFO_16909 [Tritrichomonas foetus]|eukprot:OHT12965.1 hypothetical protein TRFO_16909 [Tritrichomonas foetus]
MNLPADSGAGLGMVNPVISQIQRLRKEIEFLRKNNTNLIESLAPYENWYTKMESLVCPTASDVGRHHLKLDSDYLSYSSDDSDSYTSDIETTSESFSEEYPEPKSRSPTKKNSPLKKPPIENSYQISNIRPLIFTENRQNKNYGFPYFQNHPNSNFGNSRNIGPYMQANNNAVYGPIHNIFHNSSYLKTPILNSQTNTALNQFAAQTMQSQNVRNINVPNPPFISQVNPNTGYLITPQIAQPNRKVPYNPSNNNPNVSHNSPTISHNNPTISHNSPTISHNNPTISHNNPTISHNNPTISHNSPTISHNNPTISHNNPTISHNSPTISHNNINISHQSMHNINVVPSTNNQYNSIQNDYYNNKEVIVVDDSSDEIECQPNIDDDDPISDDSDFILPFDDFVTSFGHLSSPKDKLKPKVVQQSLILEPALTPIKKIIIEETEEEED